MKLMKRFSKTKIGQRYIGYLFFLISKMICISIRWQFVDKRNKSDIFNNKKQYIFCCWHNRLFLGPHLLPRNRVINALQSNHSDGMITSSVFKHLGMKIILGSSMKGGMQAFRKMVKSIKLGECVAITPDGPKGPKEKVKEGIIKLAQITGTPIIPLVWSTNKFKSINSWDNFVIPIPFSKGIYCFGDPIYIQKEINKKELIQAKKQLENNIKSLTDLVISQLK